MKIFTLFLATVLITLVASAWFAGRTDLRERKEVKARADQIDLALRQMRP